MWYFSKQYTEASSNEIHSNELMNSPNFLYFFHSFLFLSSFSCDIFLCSLYLHLTSFSLIFLFLSTFSFVMTFLLSLLHFLALYVILVDSTTSV